MLVHVAFILWFKWLLELKEKFFDAHVLFDFTNPPRPLKNVLVLLSDFDECAFVDNNCTKGGANCTNTVGSFNCTCQTRNFWNGIKCEGLSTLVNK